MTTAYQYDGDQMLLEKQGSATTAAYTYGNALVQEGGATPLLDGLGSARTLTNTGGTATASSTTTAFGQSVAGSTGAYGFGATSGYRGDGDGASALTDRYGDAGDDGDGLLKVGARYYDPATGSFLTRDTDLSQSPYAYCDADPVNATDPSGHIPAILTLAGIARLLAAASVIVDNALHPPGGPYNPSEFNPEQDIISVIKTFSKGIPGAGGAGAGAGAGAGTATEVGVGGLEVAGTFTVSAAEVGEVAVFVLVL